ncbi:MAG: hypothetical protein ACOCU0_00710 [Bacillota bacterium]
MSKQGLVLAVGFLMLVAGVLLGLLYGLLSETAAPGETYEYSDFDHIDALQDAESMEEAYAMVFYYELDETVSERVKHDVFNFTVEHRQEFPVYYLKGPLSEVESMTDAPALLLYENGTLSDVQSGEAGIYSVMDDVESGLIP